MIPLNDPVSSQTVLSAMITPAVMILSCASLAISTSARLGRVIDRTRKISEQIITAGTAGGNEENRKMIRHELLRQLSMSARRARLLQLSLTAVYLSLTLFVATSFALGAASVLDELRAWLPMTLGVVGIMLLFGACLLLVIDARIAVSAIFSEMDSLNRICRGIDHDLGKTG